MTNLQFYDAADWREIPDGSHAMLYMDGIYAVPPNAVDVLHTAHWHFITVLGSPAAGACDWLPDNSFDLAAYVAGRKARDNRARVYTPRAYLRQALLALGWPRAGHLWAYPGLFWWIPTLDDVQWTAESLSINIGRYWNADIPADRIWGNQWTQQPEIGPAAVRDQSTLFLEW